LEERTLKKKGRYPSWWWWTLKGGAVSSVVALSLYKNVADARLASCMAARYLARHRRFYKDSLRIPPLL